LWTREEFRKTLTPEQYKLVADLYGISGEPNFEEQYILQLARPLSEVAAERKLPTEKLIEQARSALDRLLQTRNQRKRPLTDTKVLASTNGLMIQGLATAGRILKQDEYIKRAEKAAELILTRFVDERGTLSRSVTDQQIRRTAFLDDYAFLIGGLVALHRATGDERWLKDADRLMETQLEQYWDERNGGFFFTPDDHEELIARSKVPTDGAIPSGNSVSAENLVYLGGALGKPEYLQRARRTITSASAILEQSPVAAPQLVAVIPELLEAEALLKAPDKPEAK
jgi:uncharacterized protein